MQVGYFELVHDVQQCESVLHTDMSRERPKFGLNELAPLARPAIQRSLYRSAIQIQDAC